MIKKFIKISGTGKFSDYAASSIAAPHRINEFKRINLIYGENGSGKTTLALILHSLKGGPNHLQKKRSFDLTKPQTVEVLTDQATNPRMIFASNVWDQTYPNIEIFDIHFINDNIYTGLEIQSGHQKKLFEVIFGNHGIVLKNDIQNIKEQIQTAMNEKRRFEDNIKVAVENTFLPADYCTLTIDPAIDTKIATKESEIATAKSSAEISSKSNISPISLLTLPFVVEETKQLLEKSIDTISQAYLEKVNQHKEHLGMGSKTEEWIKQGFDSIKADSCPFCMQSIDENTDIIAAYTQYFNEEYKTTIQSIARLNSTANTFNLDAQILSVESKLSSANTLIEFWLKHIPGMAAFASILGKKQDLIDSYEKAKKAINNKSVNPINSEKADAILEFEVKCTEFNTIISQYNSTIASYNAQITALKSAPPVNVATLETELKKVKRY